MAPTRTVKNKHAARNSGVKNSKEARKTHNDGVIKQKKDHDKRKPIPGAGIKGRPKIADILKKKKQRVYSEKELGLPELNTVTPVGVTKPKGKKKGKVFVDDRESMATILALVTAEKEGQIESKMIKARQMEEIREARRIEAEKKEAERKAKLEETKESLRKKRKKAGRTSSGADEEDKFVKDVVSSGSKATKSKSGGKKRVSFAAAGDDE